MKISELNDDCLYEVFDWLSLAEKCGVQRVSHRWQRITSDMISVQDSLDLYLPNHSFFKQFFETGVLGDKVKSFLSKFDCEANPNTDSEFFVDNIKHLTIANRYYGHALIEFAMVQMLTVFRNLKSIKLERVDIENWDHLTKCAENLESFVTDHFIPNSILVNLIEDCKQLRILEMLNSIDESHLNSLKRGSRNLEQITFHSSIRMLPKVISLLPKLTKIKAYFCKTHDSPNLFDSFWRLFPSLAMRKSLKEVNITFGSIVSGFGKLQLTSDCLEHIESLTLRNLALPLDDLKVIARQFPALSKLAFLNFSVDFVNKETEFCCYVGEVFVACTSDPISISFLEAISNFSKLKSLYWDPIGTHPIHQDLRLFSDKLMLSFLDAEILPSLRRLSCKCFDQCQFERCFEAFCEMASRNSKQSYAFEEFKNNYFPLKLSNEMKKSKPRNVCLFSK